MKWRKELVVSLVCALLVGHSKIAWSRHAHKGYPPVAKTVCCTEPRSRFACKEVVRYLYVVSGYTPRMITVWDAKEDSLPPEDCRSDAILMMHKDHPSIQHFHHDLQETASHLAEEHYHLQANWLLPQGEGFEAEQWPVLILLGGSHKGIQHGAYGLLEHYGLSFELHGDIVTKINWTGNPPPLPDVVGTAMPSFDVRGLQPFHDFPEGPDWWTADHYKAIFSQLSKMKMNILGLHTYPLREPTVWVGLKNEVLAGGKVSYSYNTSYANTMRGQWGYPALPTSNYPYGAWQLFEKDCYGSPVQDGNCPFPQTPEDTNVVFDKTGEMLKDAFTHAHNLSVMTCIGTETPLAMPPTASGELLPLNLYYSKERQDHFLTTTNCAECPEGVYEFLGVEGVVHSTPFPNSVPLNTYYNGQLQDNILSSTQPPGK